MERGAPTTDHPIPEPTLGPATQKNPPPWGDDHHSRAHPRGHGVPLYRRGILCSTPSTLWSTPTTPCTAPTTLCTCAGTGVHCTILRTAHCPALNTGSHCWRRSFSSGLQRARGLRGPRIACPLTSLWHHPLPRPCVCSEVLGGLHRVLGVHPYLSAHVCAVRY